MVVNHAWVTDSYLSFGLFGASLQTFFTMEFVQNPVVASPDSLIRYAVSFKRDTFEHFRSVYDILDLVGDIGGLFDGIQYIFYFLLAVWSFIFGNITEIYFYNALY